VVSRVPSCAPAWTPEEKTAGPGAGEQQSLEDVGDRLKLESPYCIDCGGWNRNRPGAFLMRPLFHSPAREAGDSSENLVKNSRNLKYRAGALVLASGAVVVFSATPAAAAPPKHFEFAEACNYVAAPHDHLVCISQGGRFSQTDTPSGKTITQTAVTTSTTVYAGATKNGAVTAWSDSTQQFNSVVKSGEPALFQLRQVIKDGNVISTTSCMITVRFVIMGNQIRQTYTEASCQ
jgi:hypothetical protein